jgi:hypothetical protein
MNEEQQELLGEVYNNYTRSKAHPLDGKYGDTSVRTLNHMYPYEPILSQEEFVDKIKTDPEFSKMWGLIIRERELNHDERFEIYKKVSGRDLQPHISGINFKQFHFDESKIPTKLITVTYTQTIESYES